ncbi:hypothetical protein [Spiroplasma culicicola]|uniref:Uncharacterized protein n=1 Tax=Spiroplasma culicicola AES-1 TaxID=1276246 RepID=W6A7Y0_9MOLU|nr:hypothetical protein [Spiroplasma culicicola]AHI53223.1 hypothetical protein SCULI_v1c08830 [Spiroplasma culicicola AES-1]
MKKILTVLTSINLIGPVVLPIQAYVINKIDYNILFRDIISSSFAYSGAWENADNDPNIPYWAYTNLDTNYSKVFSKVIKNNSYQQKNHTFLEFNIDFTLLGGNYKIAKNQYNLNVLNNVYIVFQTQAGQPAHNKVAGWPETIERISIYDILNNGNNYNKEGNNYNWGEWAALKHNFSTSWNSDKSNLKIVWKTKECRVKATKWSNGLYYRVTLENYDIEIPRIA